jgi:hypothetical protein
MDGCVMAGYLFVIVVAFDYVRPGCADPRADYGHSGLFVGFALFAGFASGSKWILYYDFSIYITICRADIGQIGQIRRFGRFRHIGLGFGR